MAPLVRCLSSFQAIYACHDNRPASKGQHVRGVLCPAVVAVAAPERPTILVTEKLGDPGKHTPCVRLMSNSNDSRVEYLTCGNGHTVGTWT